MCQFLRILNVFETGKGSKSWHRYLTGAEAVAPSALSLELHLERGG